ncbi:hypothetical protein MARINOS108_20281 [Marinoscillum sp. 108]|nr:hypothetical protein MARINOS108_20281 [Marinoscillum sp. 108]
MDAMAFSFLHSGPQAKNKRKGIVMITVRIHLNFKLLNLDI